MKICFVCLYAYPLFNPACAAAFGGSEVRAWLLANGLAADPRHEVSFVVFDHGQPGAERFGAVTVLPHPAYRPGPARWPRLSEYLGRSPRFPFVTVRRLTPSLLVAIPLAAARRLRDVVRRAAPLRLGPHEVDRGRTRVYQRIDADAYCVFGVGDLAAEVAAYCIEFGKKMVLLANSDENFSPDYAPSHSDLYRRTVAAAHAVVTQTEFQRGLVRDRFARDAVTIRNPVDLSQPRAVAGPGVDGRIALWIGRSEAVKQPLALLALARALPDIRFVMVMNRADPALFERVAREKPANVELTERLAYREAERLYARAFALINTSLFEGFPNTFLQACKHGVPLLSLSVDPDAFIREHRCGFVAAGDAGLLARQLRALHADRDAWQSCSANARRYAETYHGLDGRVRELGALLARATGLAG